MTYLLPDGLSGHQLRFNGDEECDKCPLAQASQGVVTTISAVAALLAVPQQHCRRVHLECSINLPSGIENNKNQRAVQAVGTLITVNKHTTTKTHPGLRINGAERNLDRAQPVLLHPGVY